MGVAILYRLVWEELFGEVIVKQRPEAVWGVPISGKGREREKMEVKGQTACNQPGRP